MKKPKYPKKTYTFSHGYDKDITGDGLEGRKIDGNYKYIKKNIFRRLIDTLLYRAVATPLAYLYTKLVMREKIIGKKKLRGARGYFLVGNHTQEIADAFTPNMVSFPKRCYVVISTKNMSLPVIGPLTPSLGGIPLPSDLAAARNFSRAIKMRIDGGCAVCIYPEGHVWSYYNGLRPFLSGSLDIAVRLEKPIFTFTRVYKKGRFGVKSRIYIDGPFSQDASLSRKAASEKLEAEIRKAIAERLSLSDVEVIKYVRLDEKTDIEPRDIDKSHNGAINSAECAHTEGDFTEEASSEKASAEAASAEEICTDGSATDNSL